MHTMTASPNAALFLLQDSRTDTDIVTNDGRRMLPMVRSSIAELEHKSSNPANPYREGQKFTLIQLRELEKALVERGAMATGRAY